MNIFKDQVAIAQYAKRKSAAMFLNVASVKCRESKLTRAAGAAIEQLERRVLFSGTAQHETFADLPMAAQQSISSSIGNDDVAYHATSGAKGIALANPANGFNAQVQSGALQISAGSDTWDMSPMGLGYGGIMQLLGAAQTSSGGNRVDSNYGKIDEWFVNGPAGLEQGFNVSPLSKSERTGTLTVELALTGDLIAKVTAAGHGLTLSRPNGSIALNYAGLSAHDATGKTLRTTLEVQAQQNHQCLLIHVNVAGEHGAITIDPLVQEAILTPADGTEYDGNFGESVSISGNTVVVGAGQNHDAIEAVYVFTQSGIGWSNMTQTAELTDGSGFDDNFGLSVSISGNTIVAGADQVPNGAAGAAYVFTEPASGWANMTPTAELRASDGTVDAAFGTSVAISGNTVVVGAPEAQVGPAYYRGAAYVFTQPAAGWVNMTQTAKLTASDGAYGDDFGASIAIDGGTVVVGAEGATINGHGSEGATYVFAEPGSGWVDMVQTAKLTASDGGADGWYKDYFGCAVSVSGNSVLVGASEASVGNNPDQGAAYIFTEPDSGWTNMTEAAKLTASDGEDLGYFGTSVTISGGTAVVGAAAVQASGYSGQQAAYVFTEPSTGWASTTEVTEIPEPADGLGFGTDVASSGSTFVFGALQQGNGEGAAYVFGPGTATGGGSTSSQLAFAQEPTNTLVGVSVAPPVTVDVENSSGQIVPTDNSDVTLTIGSGPAGSGLAGTLTEEAVSGVATFSNLSINTAGTYTLMATDGALSSATSTPFSITAGGGGSTSSQLAFLQQPTNTAAEAIIAPPVTVDIENSSGQLVTTDDSDVMVFIRTGPGAVPLVGTLTEQAINGVATFSDLSIGTPGTYTLAAFDNSLTSGTSAPFTVTSGGVAGAGLIPTIIADTVPSAVVAGARLHGSLKIKLTNELSTTEKGFTLNIYASPTTTLDTNADPLVIGISKGTSVKPGKSTTLSIPIKDLPASLPDGAYYLIAETIDSSGNTPYAASGSTVTVAAPFVLPVVSVGAVTPSTLEPNKMTSILVTVTNTGNVTAAGLSASLGISSDGATQVAGVTLASGSSHAKLAPGKSTRLKIHFKLTAALQASLAAGSYFPFVNVMFGGVMASVIGTTSFTVG